MLEGCRLKGIIFSSFSQFIEQVYGLECWQTMLDEVSPDSSGVYVSTLLYNDTELLGLIESAAQINHVDAKEIEFEFGLWLFPTLYSLAPENTRKITRFVDYLHTVGNVIHVEVEKLYPGAVTPNVKANRKGETIILSYQSVRKLCFFCTGLVVGCATHFGHKAQVKQTQCMHDGADCCVLEINL